MNSVRLTRRKLLMRKQLRSALLSLHATKRIKKSRRIIKKLIRTVSFKRAKNLFTYIALPYEVQTRPLILRALRLKKRVYVPSVDLKRRQIRIYQIKSWSKDLKPGPFGILEPRKLKTRRGQPHQMDLFIVPGLGFDHQNGRLGRGFGFFDRFLTKAKKTEKIGLAFREQMRKKIPMGRFDVPVDDVIVD